MFVAFSGHRVGVGCQSVSFNRYSSVDLDIDLDILSSCQLYLALPPIHRSVMLMLHALCHCKLHLNAHVTSP